MPSDLEIRPAHEVDLPRLTEIYNHYVVETPITFDVQPFSVSERRNWLDSFKSSGPHRLFAALERGRIVGYAGSLPFRNKAAYETSVETTVYVDPGCTGRGVGMELYAVLFDALRGEDLNRALVGITLPNPASIELHERFGFQRIGVYSEVGRKLGRYWDVLWLEKSLR